MQELDLGKGLEFRVPNLGFRVRVSRMGILRGLEALGLQLQGLGRIWAGWPPRFVKFKVFGTERIREDQRESLRIPFLREN